MDQNLPITAKKFWKIVRVAYFMLRKGLSKSKLMFDLNLLMKRGKIANKTAIQNLMFQGHQCPSSSKEYYEFSCSNSPTFHLNKRNKHTHHAVTAIVDDDVLMMNADVMKALEMLQSETTSPALPGFGRTPTVRQLRVTDSPFPFLAQLFRVSTNWEPEGNELGCFSSTPLRDVDEKADEFISRFYRDLKREASAFA
ncbi:hypothetical protein RND71_005461 [Anisodus tanguticus]|uniref:Uncharacterized protein n=1 Tax=Anisodus tanguticus TaxID=243964 RepID=A0AAE1VV11_9SOLA|nr:hypothetical protein RND71_005461 [Anisodus tanguticus]